MKFQFIILSLIMMGCGSSLPDRQIASKPGLGEESIPPEEAKATKEILALIQEGYSNYKPKDLKPRAHRIIHGKEHGCVSANFNVLEGIPSKFKQGIFKDEKASFPAWVRLSNGSGSSKYDGIPDGRGIAIKLMNVSGQKLGDETGTQDFLLQNSPVFFAADVEAYVKFMKTSARPGFKGVSDLIKSVNPGDKRDLKGLQILASSAASITNPLTASYFSALPQKLGPHAMKLMAKPCPGSKSPKIEMRERFKTHFLKEMMTKHLNESSACIELSIQIQTDSVKMPIEDATVKWNTDESPFVPVAHIIVPKQKFLSQKRVEFCEHIAFSPWHSIQEHRPLGGLNRVRKVVYEKSSLLRHEMNSQRADEPNSNEKYE